MNTGAKKLLIFTRDLLSQPEGTVVIIGRENMKRNNFTDLQIVIDNIDVSTPIGFSTYYDGESEKMFYYAKISAPATINFYGDGAYQEAMKFSLLWGSQIGYQLGLNNMVEINQVSGILDLKQLTGDQYSERLQLSLIIKFNEQIDQPTLRVDTLQSNFLINQ